MVSCKLPRICHHAASLRHTCLESSANDGFPCCCAGDTNMRTLQKGDVLQLERKGYFIVDEPLTKPGKPMVLFNIPDGRTKNMTAPKQSGA
eukprot:1137380-Pelagomonas_calceolata.AAC.11